MSEFTSLAGQVLFWSAFLGLFVYLLSSDVRTHRATKKNRKALKDSGFGHDYVLECHTPMIFDQAQRKLALVCADGITTIAYSKIASVEWQWVSKGSHRTDWLSLSVLDPQRPLIKIVLPRRKAELWQAKVTAILASS